MSKTNRSVVRNQAYQKKGISIRERHNERENETYYNADIQQDRQFLNVYFKQSEGGYSETFEKMITDGIINTRGLKSDAKVFDEMIFDVNTEYFDRNGGYEYAKSFFEEAYRSAVKEIGGEEYILSAVMHADERNKALSEQLGRDVYHYHLHIIYVPVVDKEVLWSKRCKDPELVGTVKETIKQVSHSKKWPRYKTAEGWVNSYSLLQDRFHDHMKNAGYIGFERGEVGSTAEHLSAEEYKTQQEKKRNTAITAEIEHKQSKLNNLNEKITVKEKAAATIDEIDTMGKPTMFGGGFTVTADEMKKLKTNAKRSIKAEERADDAKRQLSKVTKERDELKKQLDKEKKNRPSVTQNLNWFEKFTAAMLRAPKRLMEVITEILNSPPERKEPERSTPEKKRGNYVDR